jgi:hypothetical protein
VGVQPGEAVEREEERGEPLAFCELAADLGIVLGVDPGEGDLLGPVGECPEEDGKEEQAGDEERLGASLAWRGSRMGPGQA